MWERDDLEKHLNMTLDERLGVLAFDVYGCGSVTDGYLLPALSRGLGTVPGVRVEIDAPEAPADAPEPTFFYGYPPFPDPSGQTDTYGQVYVANVPPGPVVVRATVGEDLLGELRVRVEADRVTSFHMVPTPVTE